MMIEAVPFFHILVNIIQAEVGDDVSFSSAVQADKQDKAIISTTMVAFAFSSILTGKLLISELSSPQVWSFSLWAPLSWAHLLVISLDISWSGKCPIRW